MTKTLTTFVNAPTLLVKITLCVVKVLQIKHA